MNSGSLRALVGVLALTWSVSAAAEGGYFSLGVNEVELDEGGVDGETVGSAAFGWMLTDYVGVEIGYYDLLDIDEPGFAADGSAVTLAGVLMAPIGDHAVVYAKLGASSIDADATIGGVSVNADGEEAFGGVGFEIRWDNFAVYAEYMRFDTEFSDVDVYGVGVRIHFGG